MLTREQRCDRLDDLTRRGLIVRGEWTDGEQSCLLAALSPEVRAEKKSDVCPASVIPAWLARITPSLNDYTSSSYWPEMVREYGRVVRRAAVLTSEDWALLDYAARAVLLRVALSRWIGKSVLDDWAGAAQHVLSLCDRAASGYAVREDHLVVPARDSVCPLARVCASGMVWEKGAFAWAANTGSDWDLVAKGILAAIDARCAEREAAQ